VRVLPAAVDQHRLDRRLGLDRVEVRAQQQRALGAAGDPREQVADPVLLGLHSHAAQLRDHALRARTLVPERARDPAEVGEQLREPGLLGLGRRPHVV
jgi:hypothetical protein